MKQRTVGGRWFMLTRRGTLGVLGLLFVASGCWTTRKDVSHKEPYTELVGTTWRLKEGLYIVEYTDGSGKPGVLRTASHATNGDHTVVDEKHVGKTFLDTIIKGLLPKGTEVRVLNVVEIKDFEGYDPFDIMVRPAGELGKKWPKLEGADLEEKGWVEGEKTGEKEFQVKMNRELVEPVPPQ